MYLLDTNVVSELRRRHPHGAVVTWLQNTPDSSLFLSAVTIGELQAGAEITREQDADKAKEIEAWIDSLSLAYNILPMDTRAFRVWAKLLHRQSDTLYEDAMIAAIAIVHNLVVVTHNVRDFRSLGVETLNPFESPPRER